MLTSSHGPPHTSHPENQWEKGAKLHTSLLLCGEICLGEKGGPAADISREGRAGQGRAAA